MARPKKQIHEKCQYKRDFITKSLRLDLHSKIEKQIAEFLSSLPNYNQFIKTMIVNTIMFEKYCNQPKNDFFKDDATGKYGFM
jgi:hypothetical protein